MKKLIFVLIMMMAVPAISCTAAKAKHSKVYVKKQAKKSLPFAHTHDRKMNRKGLMR